MKKLALALAVISAVASLGCETEVDLGNRPRFGSTNYSMTVLAYDGITGVPITNAVVTAQVGPYTIEADHNGNAYTFTYMPNDSYPIFVRAEGYLGFTSTSYRFDDIYDTRTVQLFKKQSVDTDLNIKVYNGADGSPVVGGQVLVNVSSVANVYTDHRQLSGTFDEMPTIFVVPLANGSAVIPKEQLVFGATYDVDVIGAKNADGKYLQPQIANNNSSFRCKVGFEYQQINIFMGQVAETPMAISTNSEKTDQNFDVLTVTFPYPVELCGTATPSITISPNYDADVDGIRSTAAATPVTSALSQGDTVLTLTPSFASRDTAGEDLQVTFNNVQVQVKGTSGCTSLESVRLRETGSFINRTIDMQD